MENMKYAQPAQPNGTPAAASPTGNETKLKPAPAFDIQEFMYRVLSNWYWFIICTTVAFLVAYFYIRTQQPIYERVSDIAIKPQSSQNGGELNVKEYLGLQSSSVNMSGELYILRSLKLATRIAEEQKMDIRYYYQGAFRKAFVYEDRPFSVFFEQPFRQYLLIAIRPTSLQTFTISSIWVGGERHDLEDNESTFFFGSSLKLPVTGESIIVSIDNENTGLLSNAIGQTCYVSLSHRSEERR